MCYLIQNNGLGVFNRKIKLNKKPKIDSNLKFQTSQTLQTTLDPKHEIKNFQL
jgi:hypothetical protein